MGEEIIKRPPTPEELIQFAIEKGTPVDTMERLLVMRKDLKQEHAKEAYVLAMAEFQGECPIIHKSKTVADKNGKPRYSYAPIESIVSQVRELLKKYGFSYSVDALTEPDWVTATCKVTHDEGHSEVSSFKIPIQHDAYMNEPQKFASALTYAKRYAFCNAFGILTGDEDDDSTSVVAEEAKIVQPPKKQEPPKQPLVPEEKPISLNDVVDSGKWKDKLWQEVPLGYLKSLKDPKYWVNVPPRKKDIIERTIIYQEALKVEEEKKTKTELDQNINKAKEKLREEKTESIPIEGTKSANTTTALFDKDGVIKDAEKEKEQVLKDTLDSMDCPELDPKKEQDAPDSKLVEFVEFLLTHTVLFPKEEANRIIDGNKQLGYNMVIANFKQLKIQYERRWQAKWGKTQ